MGMGFIVLDLSALLCSASLRHIYLIYISIIYFYNYIFFYYHIYNLFIFLQILLPSFFLSLALPALLGLPVPFLFHLNIINAEAMTKYL